jgi:hypothetical protein
MTGFQSKRKSAKEREMEDMKEFDAYLGDGVYASFDGIHIWLAANHPENKTVALDPSVFDNLVAYEKRLTLSAMAVDGNA